MAGSKPSHLKKVPGPKLLRENPMKRLNQLIAVLAVSAASVIFASAIAHQEHDIGTLGRQPRHQ